MRRTVCRDYHDTFVRFWELSFIKPFLNLTFSYLNLMFFDPNGQAWRQITWEICFNPRKRCDVIFAPTKNDCCIKKRRRRSFVCAQICLCQVKDKRIFLSRLWRQTHHISHFWSDINRDKFNGCVTSRFEGLNNDRQTHGQKENKVI